MRVLVTGGAGYVGSVSVEALVAAGHDVVVLDDLSKGHRDAVVAGARFVEGSYGYSFERPVRHMREYLDALLPLVREGSVSYAGETVTAPRITAFPGQRWAPPLPACWNVPPS